jgi:protein TonB
MSVLTLSRSSPWSLGHEQDRRFYLILSQTVAASVLLSVAIHYFPIPQAETEAEKELPLRYVQLLAELPRPASEPAAIAAPKAVSPALRKQPSEQRPLAPVTTTREKVTSTGVLAMRDALAKLQLRSAGTASYRGEEMPGAELDPGSEQSFQLTENLSGDSAEFDGGVDHEAVLGEADWPQRSDTRPAGAGLAVNEAAESGTSVAPRGRTRTQEEIQEQLDRNKGAMYTLYNRELRNNAGLQGELVLRVSIAPTGNVTRCVVISSELGADSLERQLVALIKSIDFGNKAGAAPVTTNIPIEFFPQ